MHQTIDIRVKTNAIQYIVNVFPDDGRITRKANKIDDIHNTTSRSASMLQGSRRFLLARARPISDKPFANSFAGSYDKRDISYSERI